MAFDESELDRWFRPVSIGRLNLLLSYPIVLIDLSWVRPEFLRKTQKSIFWPQIRRDYPLNLSILISGGKETNKDSPSNGEWSGNSSSLKSPLLATANCSLEKRFQAGCFVLKLPGTAHRRGWQSRTRLETPVTKRFPWVGLLGNAAQNGR